MGDSFTYLTVEPALGVVLDELERELDDANIFDQPTRRPNGSLTKCALGIHEEAAREALMGVEGRVNQAVLLFEHESAAIGTGEVYKATDDGIALVEEIDGVSGLHGQDIVNYVKREYDLDVK